MLTLRYAITDKYQRSEAEDLRRSALVEQAARLTEEGVDFIQVRERDLDARELIGVVREMISMMRQKGSHTRLLIHSRADVGLAAGAHGVHLASGAGQLTCHQAKRVFGGRQAVVSVSAHTIEEVRRADAEGADLILFGPVFGKTVKGEVIVPATGLEALRAACEAAGKTPVLALGGVTARNTADCIGAGASGIAGIRLFQ